METQAPTCLDFSCLWKSSYTYTLLFLLEALNDHFRFDNAMQLNLLLAFTEQGNLAPQRKSHTQK